MCITEHDTISLVRSAGQLNQDLCFYTSLHTVPVGDDQQMQKSVQVYKGVTLEELLRCACMERRGAGRSRSASARPVTRAMLFFLFMSMSSTMSPTTLLNGPRKSSWDQATPELHVCGAKQPPSFMFAAPSNPRAACLPDTQLCSV